LFFVIANNVSLAIGSRYRQFDKIALSKQLLTVAGSQ
jgi:hypothetical protein